MPAIKYQFIAEGVPSVVDGFRSIEDAAKNSSKAVEQGMRSIRTSSRDVVRESGTATKAQEKFAKDLAAAGKKAEIADRKRAAEESKEKRAYVREQERAAKHVAGIKERHFRDQQKLGEKADAVRRKETAKEVSDKRAHEDRIRSIKERSNDKNRENERRHVARMDSIKRDEAKREAAHQEKLKAGPGIRERYAQETKLADRNLRFQKELSDKRKSLDDRGSFARGVGSAARGAFIGGSVATVASIIGIAGSSARQSLALHEVANRVSINSRGAGETAIDPRILRKEFERTADQTPGLSALDIGNAVQQFVTKTGNLDVARKSQGVFATVASATGSNVGDISEAAADLFQKFDIKSIDDMSDALAALAFQGKAGSFELKDAASQFARLASAASRFGLGKGVEGVKTLGGLTQIAKESTGSPEQAATAIEAMFRQFTSHHALGKLRKLDGGGVNPFLDKGQTKTKEIRGLLVETITKAGGNLEKLQGIFGDEGIRAVSKIISSFNDAKQTASVGGASIKASNSAGADAAKSYIDKMIDAPGDYKELQRDAAQAQQDASAKISGAWDTIVGKLSDGAIPAIASLVSILENSPGAIEALVGTIDNLAFFFGALISATQDLLEFFHISSKKVISPEEKQAQARKKAEIAKSNLERFDKKRGGSLEQVMDLQHEAGQLRKDKKFKEAAAKEKEAEAMRQKLTPYSSKDVDRLQGEADKLRAGGKTQDAIDKQFEVDAMKKKVAAIAEQDTERSRLVGEFEHAKKQVGLAGGEIKTVQDQSQRIRSSDTFATEYAAMLDTTNPSDKEANMVRAKTIAKAMSGEAPNDYLTSQDKMGNESDEAFQFRTRQMKAREESASLVTGGKEGGASASDMSAAMAKVEAAAKAMEQAANAIKSTNQTSVIPQP